MTESESLGHSFARLADDARAFAKAEFALRKAQATVEAEHYRLSLILGVVALAAFHLALIALTVGLVIAVAERLGGWAATGIVTALFLVIAAVAGYAARASLTRPRP